MPRRCWFAVFCLLGCAPLPLQAGVYTTAEPEPGRAGKAEEINRLRETLFRLRSLALDKVEVDNPMRKRYVLQADLAGSSNLGKLTLEEKLNLSEVLLRRNRPTDALQLLVGLAREAPDNPLVQSNLATAYHLSGELRQAIDTMDGLLAEGSRTWSWNWAKLTEAQRQFLQAAGFNENFEQRKAEKLYAKLLRLRFREAARKAKPGDENVDALFDDGKSPASPARFVNRDGVFEPGKLAAAEKAKIPPDAIDTVQQLLLWLPNDFRLYRLLGELYNAGGTPADVRAADLIFDDLVRNKYTPGDVLERQQKLVAYVAQLPDPNQELLEKFNTDLKQIEKPVETPFDWRSLMIAFAFGFIVALFAIWQVRELRRRRQTRLVQR